MSASSIRHTSFNQRPFYARHWLQAGVNKFVRARYDRQESRGALVITGASGAGKTAFVKYLHGKLDEPTDEQAISVVAVHYCQRYDAASAEVATVLRTLAEQLATHASTPNAYRRAYADVDNALHAHLRPRACLRRPVQSALTAIVEPLCAAGDGATPPPLVILIDALDESICESGDSALSSLLAGIAPHLPHWLTLVCTTSIVDAVIGTFTTQIAHDISIDDTRTTPHIAGDMQTYVLARLDRDSRLRSQLDGETAEMLNQLTSTTGNMLYVQLLLDGVRDGFVRMRELPHIPATLNGLYLWLCARLFSARAHVYDECRILLEIMLASRQPVTVRQLYAVARARNSQLNKTRFGECIKCLGPLIVEHTTTSTPSTDDNDSSIRTLGSQSTVLIFHPSFEHWLTDVKYCTRTYLCAPSAGHGAWAVHLAARGAQLNGEEIVLLAYHLTQMHTIGVQGDTGALCALLLQSGARVQDLVLDCPVVDAATTRLLYAAGADFATMNGCLTDDEDTTRCVEEDEVVAADAHAPKDNTHMDKSQSSDEGINETLMSLDCLTLTLSLHHLASVGDTQALRAQLARMTATADATRPRLTTSTVATARNRLDDVDTAGDTALCLAAKNGHAHVVEELAKAGADVNHIGSEQWTPLRSATFAAHTATVEVLLKYGAGVDVTGADRRRPLRAACWAGHVDLVRMLLAHGADIRARDDCGRTPLMTAAYLGHTNVVRTLLSNTHGLANDVDMDGRSALSLCAIAAPSTNHDQLSVDGVLNEHVRIAQLLIEAGADVNITDRFGRTPLFSAAIEGFDAMCAVLVASGRCDVDMCDAGGCTPLSAAAACGHARLVSALIVAGADVNTVDNDGRSVLTVAAAAGHTTVVAALLDEHGMDEFHADNAGLLPVHYAAAHANTTCLLKLITHNPSTLVAPDKHNNRQPLYIATNESHAANVRALINAGAYVDCQTHEGETPLRCACMNENGDIAEALLSAGASVDVCDSEGHTIVDACVTEGRTRLLPLLLEQPGAAGVLLSTTDTHGRTPLHVACALGNVHAANVLAAYGADIDAADRDGNTPLMTALWCSQVACARALLARGAHTDTRLAVSGATPLHIGAQVGSVDTVCALVEYGGDTRAVDNYGRRPTDVARQCAHAHIVRLLDDADASTTAQRAANGKHRLHTAHSATLDSGVSSNNDQDSPPSTWPAKTPNVTLLSEFSQSPESTGDDNGMITSTDIFRHQLITRSQQRPFSGVFNMSTSTVEHASTPPSGASHTSSSARRRQRPRIVTNPKYRESTTTTLSRSTTSAGSDHKTTTVTPSHTSDDLRLATMELEKFLTSTEAVTSVV